MNKYSLTSKQRDILRAIAEGIRDGSVDTEWLYSRAIGDVYTDLSGFARAQELQMKESDLSTFANLGFISHGEKRTNCVAYHVYEQSVLDAVDNDFDMPGSSSSSGSVQNISIGSISSSNVNIGLKLDQINQKIHTISSLPDEDKTELTEKLEELKAELEKLQNTNPKEAQAVAKQLDRVVDDLAEDQPDQESVKISLEGLKHAASNLIAISPMVFSLATNFIQFVSNLRV